MQELSLCTRITTKNNHKKHKTSSFPLRKFHALASFSTFPWEKNLLTAGIFRDTRPIANRHSLSNCPKKIGHLLSHWVWDQSHNFIQPKWWERDWADWALFPTDFLNTTSQRVGRITTNQLLFQAVFKSPKWKHMHYSWPCSPLSKKVKRSASSIGTPRNHLNGARVIWMFLDAWVLQIVMSFAIPLLYKYFWILDHPDSPTGT